MKSNYQNYVHADSIARIDDVLDATDSNYEELDEIPSRDRLTFTNGFYIKRCTALFVDLRDSSDLPVKHSKARLAKIYRSYISESVAVINGNIHCAEVNIHGDGVWGVFDARYKEQVDAVLDTAASLNSLIKSMNCRYAKRGIEPIRAGIGASWGRALMVKAGYKGSAINEVVWMGDVVNEAAGLCNKAAKWPNKAVIVSADFHGNLKDDYQKLMVQNYSEGFYHGDVIDLRMEAWWEKNCQ